MEDPVGGNSRKETMADMVKTKKRRTASENANPLATMNGSSSTTPSANNRSNHSNSKSRRQKSQKAEPLRPPPVLATETEVIYEPETILFRVRWKGYSELDDTMEPLSNLEGCLKLVKAYLIRRRGQLVTVKSKPKKEADSALIEILMQKVDRLLEAGNLESAFSSRSVSPTPIDVEASRVIVDQEAPFASPAHSSPPPPPPAPLRSERTISISSTEDSASSASLSSLSSSSRQSSQQQDGSHRSSPRPLRSEGQTRSPAQAPALSPSPSPPRQTSGRRSNLPSQQDNGNSNDVLALTAPLTISKPEANAEPGVVSKTEMEEDKDDNPNENPKVRFERQLARFRSIFSGLPWPPITVKDPPPEATFQENFKFIDQSVLHKDLSNLESAASEFMMRCQCGPAGCRIEADGSTECECLKEAMTLGLGVPFDEQGRISVHLKSTAVWVCNRLCSCGPNCVTKASSLGRPAKLQLRWTGPKGWGVFLDQDEPIPPRTFISRYVGEIITTDEAERRGREYDRQGATYLFDMDCNNDNEAVYTIDAQRMGNESHFFNHSCRPNLQVYNLFGEHADVNMMTPSFWTIRTIRKGEELTFDYNGLYKASWLRQSDDRSSESEAENGDGISGSYMNGHHGSPTRQQQHQQQQQRPPQNVKGKRRRRIDSEDDYPDTDTNNFDEDSVHQLSINAGLQTSQTKPLLSSFPNGKRPPVDRSRAARKCSSGGARIPAYPPASSNYSASSSSFTPAESTTASAQARSQARRRSSGDAGTFQIRCLCGDKRCRKFVHSLKKVE
ncbi:hypothetical protein BGZ73_006433 [Actinomortierella ambigua]|nr:hypothetical protein BGZ73_006433 [Actinomortierella ambigua]